MSENTLPQVQENNGQENLIPANLGEETSGMLRADPRLLELLVCPLARVPLEYDANAQELISRSARLAYPIRDGIPILLPDEARVLPG